MGYIQNVTKWLANLLTKPSVSIVRALDYMYRAILAKITITALLAAGNEIILPVEKWMSMSERVTLSQKTFLDPTFLCPIKKFLPHLLLCKSWGARVLVVVSRCGSTIS